MDLIAAVLNFPDLGEGLELQQENLGGMETYHLRLAQQTKGQLGALTRRIRLQQQLGVYVQHVARHWRVCFFQRGPALLGLERFESRDGALFAAAAWLRVQDSARRLRGEDGWDTLTREMISGLDYSKLEEMAVAHFQTEVDRQKEPAVFQASGRFVGESQPQELPRLSEAAPIWPPKPDWSDW